MSLFCWESSSGHSHFYEGFKGLASFSQPAPYFSALTSLHNPLSYSSPEWFPSCSLTHWARSPFSAFTKVFILFLECSSLRFPPGSLTTLPTSGLWSKAPFWKCPFYPSWELQPSPSPPQHPLTPSHLYFYLRPSLPSHLVPGDIYCICFFGLFLFTAMSAP